MMARTSAHGTTAGSNRKLFLHSLRGIIWSTCTNVIREFKKLRRQLQGKRHIKIASRPCVSFVGGMSQLTAALMR